MPFKVETLDVAFLLVRLTGLAMAAHGAQKLFGWFGGHGLAGTGGFFEKMGFRPGRLFAFAAGAGETGGGTLLFLGLGGALGPALTVLVMIVAAITVHLRNGYFQAKNGWELNSLYIAVALAVGYAGPGSLSLDHALGIDFLTSPGQVTLSFAAAAVLAGANVIARRRPAPAAT
jgi:putative oxidoreductase